MLSHWSTPSLYEATCDLRCEDYDYTHFTFIFTAFVMCQLFNECVGWLGARGWIEWSTCVFVCD